LAECVFVDTNPLIYLLDNVQPFVLPVKDFLLRHKNLNAEFYTSTVTDAEFFVKPIEENQLDKIDLYLFCHESCLMWLLIPQFS